MYKVKFEKEMNKLKKNEFGNHQHYIFYNNKLTSDEKIILIDLLNNNSNFNSNISGISYFMNLLKCGKDKIFSIFKKLEEKGYIVRKTYFVNTPTKKTISEIHIQLHNILFDYKKQIEVEEKLKEEAIQQENEFIRIDNKGKNLVNLQNKDLLTPSTPEGDITNQKPKEVLKKAKISNIKRKAESESTPTAESTSNLQNKDLLTPSTPEGDIVDQKQFKEPKKVDIKEEMISYIERQDWEGPLLENINNNYQLFSELIEKYYKNNKTLFDRSKNDFLYKGFKYLTKKLINNK